MILSLSCLLLLLSRCMFGNRSQNQTRSRSDGRALTGLSMAALSDQSP
jgi:hypothetical protein